MDDDILPGVKIRDKWTNPIQSGVEKGGKVEDW